MLTITHSCSMGFRINNVPVCADQVERLAAGAPYVRGKGGQKVRVTKEELEEIRAFLPGYGERANSELYQLNRYAMYG